MSFDIAANNATGFGIALPVALIAPVITLNPADQTAGLGATATFTAAATGSLPIGWQWQVLRTA